ncbi:MAG: hypothetical protein V7643_408 [Mycobacterium sp.]|jgi:selenocysteine lyase/cysteine desulfurase
MGRQAEIAGIRALLRVGAVRVDFHVYNTEDDLERLLGALGALAPLAGMSGVGLAGVVDGRQR